MELLFAARQRKTALNRAVVVPMKTVVLVSWLAMCVFLFGLPHWSNMANQEYWDFRGDSRAPAGLCSTDPMLFQCTDGRDFVELATAAGRLGCGCGEGIFGEALCPLSSGGITLSTLVSTATGGGCFMLFTVVPMMAMWLHVAQIHFACTCRLGKVDLWNLGMPSLLAFQMCIAGIVAVSTCIWGTAHKVVSASAFVFLGIHLALLSWTTSSLLGSKTVVRVTVGMAVPGALAFPLISVLGGYWFQESPSILNGALFHYGECVGLALAMGIAPLLLLMGEMDDFLYGGLS